MSSPDIRILPLCDSNILNNALISELFPEPVLPTIPIFSLGYIIRLISFKTISERPLYVAEYFWNSICGVEIENLLFFRYGQLGIEGK